VTSLVVNWEKNVFLLSKAMHTASIEPDVPRMIVLHKFILFWLKKSK